MMALTFWYKIAGNNWLRDDVCKIDKVYKASGVVWISGTNINLHKGLCDSKYIRV